MNRLWAIKVRVCTMRIKLRERDQKTRRWSTVIDQRVSVTSCTRVPPIDLNESSELILFLNPETHDDWGDKDTWNPYGLGFEARLLVGNVLVASSREQDRPDYSFRLSSEGDDVHEHYTCTGRLLRDWVGETNLTVQVLRTRPDDDPALVDDWCAVLDADLCIAAGKLEQEAFEALCADIADHSADVLLDVYGKTFVNLELERKRGDSAPIVAMQRIRQAIDQLKYSLRAISRRPAYRLKTYRVREPVLADQSVSDLTLEETCLDPTLANPLPNGRIHFREHVHERASPNYDLPENRMIAGFLQFLEQQIQDLHNRMVREIQVREGRREYRHRRTSGGNKTWWESEDLPRIQELGELARQVSAMGRELSELQRSPFLPRMVAPLRHAPASTPLIRSHKAYSNVFKTIVLHFQAFRVQVDDEHLVMRAKSLPVLYEWWCLLEVMRSLRSCLKFGEVEDFGPQSPFRRLQQERESFVVDFEPDQAVDFEDVSGNVVRLRYVPSYRGYEGERGPKYGLLGDERERTPDVALEIYLGGNAFNRPPDAIIVMDAKYSSEPHVAKLDEVKRKYGKIGVFQTGKVLSQQVWALTPAPAARARARVGTLPEWALFSTVDNVGFWSEAFDVGSSVVGVIQAKPKMPAGRTPLESLLRLLLKRAGVTLKG